MPALLGLADAAPDSMDGPGFPVSLPHCARCATRCAPRAASVGRTGELDREPRGRAAPWVAPASRTAGCAGEPYRGLRWRVALRVALACHTASCAGVPHRGLRGRAAPRVAPTDLDRPASGRKTHGTGTSGKAEVRRRRGRRRRAGRHDRVRGRAVAHGRRPARLDGRGRVQARRPRPHLPEVHLRRLRRDARPSRNGAGRGRRPGGSGRVLRREHLLGAARGALEPSQGPGAAARHRPARRRRDGGHRARQPGARGRAAQGTTPVPRSTSSGSASSST